jgi:hypothetical protein
VQRVLQTLLRGVFRSRWTLALALAVIIVAIVVLARLLAGPAPNRVLDRDNTPAPTISDDPHGDDSVISPAPPPSPSVGPGTAAPAAVAYAFASAWVDHVNVSGDDWRDRMLPHMTTRLADELVKTDPAVVPASRVTGQPTVTPLSELVVEASVATDAGELVLQLVAPDGKWLVDSIDWRKA